MFNSNIGKEMMREEEIKKAADKFQREFIPKDKNNERFCFISGVLWADEHSKSSWISVKERLPEKNCVVFVSLDGTEYLSVHFSIKSHRFITVAKDKQHLLKEESVFNFINQWYDKIGYFSKGEREDVTDDVTHWMPIPELPRNVE